MIIHLLTLLGVLFKLTLLGVLGVFAREFGVLPDLGVLFTSSWTLSAMDPPVFRGVLNPNISLPVDALSSASCVDLLNVQIFYKGKRKIESGKRKKEITVK